MTARNLALYSSPAIETEDQRILPLPLQCIVIWDRQMGQRLMRARKMSCNRVDRRTPDWRHRVSYWGSRQCTCINQIDTARRLGVSQAQLSRIEQGQKTFARVNIPSLLSVFKDLTTYILTGENAREIEAKSRIILE